MKTKGKFIHCTVDEFRQWLLPKNFSRKITLIQNHHTYIPNYTHFNGNNHFEMVESMERSHILRGFAEIAQNITTYPDGTLMICRSFEKIPAGIKGANATGICMEHIGHFDTGGDAMTVAHRDTIVALNAIFCNKFNLPVDTNSIVYHHWYDLNTGQRTNGTGITKSCPGTNFFGGNKVHHAQANFIPLVNTALQNYIPRPMPAAPLKTVMVTASKLNVRIKPHIAASIAKVLTQGVELSVYEERGDWYKIHPTAENWVFGRYVK